MSNRNLFCQAAVALMFAIGCVVSSTKNAAAAIVTGDPLELAVAPPIDFTNDTATPNGFKVFGDYQFVYDDNVYRLPSYETVLSPSDGFGSNASRQDHINMVSAGADGQWTVGRQVIDLDLDVDDNRYEANSNLNNVSTKDKIVWNWDIGSVLSGQVGADYNRGLISFINANSYGRDLYSSYDAFAAGRYQLGPRWAIFGGFLDNATSLSEHQSAANNIHADSVAVGTDYSIGEKNTIGLEYRYTDARYPTDSIINYDYREDAARLIVTQIFSEKTTVYASVGFLRREYAALAIESFSGDVWRVGVAWRPTDKLKFGLDAWRNLQAYVTSQSDYYVSTGTSFTPEWKLTEKVSVSGIAAFESQNYIGIGETELLQGQRRDKLTTYTAALNYMPFDFLTVALGYTRERRTSDEALFEFDDNLYNIRVTGKW